jgi:membrane protease YdiL (CAAX protease family)
MENGLTGKENSLKKIGYFLLFLISGLLLFVMFNHMRPMLPEGMDIFLRVFLALAFLGFSLLAHGSQRFAKFSKISFAAFIASLATGIDLYLPSRDWLLKILNISIDTPAGIALDKLDSSLVISSVIILLTLVSGNNLGSIYLKKVNLKKGLIIGSIAFTFAVAGSIPIAELFFGAGKLELNQVLSWTPWIFIFILGNAFNEELLFRGLFLQKLDPFLGKFLSDLVISIPFALHHSGVSYTPNTLLFLALLLPLSLAWGAITQKTDSLWGSVLFHAGTDIPVVLAIFAGLP